jgi:predicted transcriptional regulator
MQHQRSDSITHEQMRRVEAAILALMLAEDWPWQARELATRLNLPESTIRLGTATLRADGLIDLRDKRLRASRTAVRCDELLRRRYVPSPTRTNVELLYTPKRPR